MVRVVCVGMCVCKCLERRVPPLGRLLAMQRKELQALCGVGVRLGVLAEQRKHVVDLRTCGKVHDALVRAVLRFAPQQTQQLC